MAPTMTSLPKPTIFGTVEYLWTVVSFLWATTHDDVTRPVQKNISPVMPDVTNEFDETEFDSFVRKHIIIWLLYVVIYLSSYWMIQFFKTKTDNDELYAGVEDFHVYRISIWICACSLATSIGAVTLLPFSILGSEVLLLYPDNYYLQWLNWSLINSMWTYIFFLSNLSLFFLLPFAYFFLESQGFSFMTNRTTSVQARVLESVAVCCLVLVLLVILGSVFFSLSMSAIYSMSSFIGVCILLVSTPYGLSKIFDVFSGLLTSSSGNSSRIDDASVDEDVRRLRYLADSRRENGFVIVNGHVPGVSNSCCFLDSTRLPSPPTSRFPRFRFIVQRITYVFELLKYPIVVLLLLLLTLLSVSIVLVNTLQLLFGFRALPMYVQYVEVHARHTFGIIGACVETVILLYIMVASVVGVYSMPLLRGCRPRKSTTSMTSIIGNCGLILLLSSALPVLARTLGITSFDLLGAYGRLDWISNFSLIVSYNVLFAVLSVLTLANKFTLPVRREIVRRITAVTRHRRRSSYAPSSLMTAAHAKGE